MSAPVIDFGPILAARTAAVQMAREIAEQRTDYIVKTIEAWADRAHKGTADLFTADPELARVSNRWCARKLRGEIRRAIRPLVPPAGLGDIVDMSTEAFWSRLSTLHQVAKAARNGGAQ